MRRELRLRFTLVPLSLLSVFPMLSSLLRVESLVKRVTADPKGPSGQFCRSFLGSI